MSDPKAKGFPMRDLTGRTEAQAAKLIEMDDADDTVLVPCLNDFDEVVDEDEVYDF